jgi:hypothetical protein
MYTSLTWVDCEDNLALLKNVRLDWKKLVRYKHSSFMSVLKEKFYNIYIMSVELVYFKVNLQVCFSSPFLYCVFAVYKLAFVYENAPRC